MKDLKKFLNENSHDARTKLLTTIIAGIIVLLSHVCIMTLLTLFDYNPFRNLSVTILIWIIGAILYAWTIHLYLSDHYLIKYYMKKAEGQGEEEPQNKLNKQKIKQTKR